MKVVARPASAGDADRLTALRTRATSEVAGQRGGALLVRAELSGAEGNPGSGRLLAVVEIEDAVVGYLDAEMAALEGGGQVCRVTSLYVEPEAREVGAGEALMDHVKDWASARHAEGIDVLALPGAREVKNFFETAGFAARLIVMHHRLGDR
ncbi:MAG: GNAT family N-acetyltransferase [Acidimicrobiales bacterium]